MNCFKFIPTHFEQVRPWTSRATGVVRVGQNESSAYAEVEPMWTIDLRNNRSSQPAPGALVPHRPAGAVTVERSTGGPQ